MKTKKAVIYTRVSDPDQVHNYSLSAQEIDINKFAKQNSIQIV
jgi:DNA invertase Pin-like site-specific DNA recombinase